MEDDTSSQCEAIDSTPEAQTAALLAVAIRRIEQTVFSQLECLGKTDPAIRNLAENLKRQGLLDIDAILPGALQGDPAHLGRLKNHADLLIRWLSAILAGAQSALLAAPEELSAALNPSNWVVEKKRWSSEPSAYWNHYQYAVRPELPLAVGDRLRSLAGQKTIEAYSILGDEGRR